MTQEARSHGTYVLILKLQETSPECFVDLFICRLIYNMLPFNYKIFRFFPVFFTLFFYFPCVFYIFHLAKLLLALDAPIVIPVNLNFFLI